jgi:hypothetical protein
MHLTGNLSDLLISLWHGSIDCVTTDDITTWDWVILCDNDAWQAHGKTVEKAGPYLPGSFNVKPRNIAEKINTDYKTWEFLLYTFGLGLVLLYGHLPKRCWRNYCKLVRGFQIVCQHSITAKEVCQAHHLLCSWQHEFEELYYQ